MRRKWQIRIVHALHQGGWGRGDVVNTTVQSVQGTSTEGGGEVWVWGEGNNGASVEHHSNVI